MDEIDRVADRNRAIETPVFRQEIKHNKKEVLAVAKSKEQIRDFPIARLIALKPDAIIPIHLDKHGIAMEDIAEEWPCALNRAYFIKKNLRLLNLTLAEGRISSALEFQVFSVPSGTNNPANMFVELFRGREECELLSVTDTYDCFNIDSGMWTVTCEGVPMEVSQKVQKIYGSLKSRE